MYFKPQSPSISLSKELEHSTRLLESLPEYAGLVNGVHADLNPSGKVGKSGRQGMTAEQVMLAMIVRSRKNYSYRELSEATHDSLSCREFLKIEPSNTGFSYKTLQSNIKQISEGTLDALHTAIKNYGQSSGIEDGTKTRTDATAIKTNIHYPTDTSLMHDCIHVISRIMTVLFEIFGVPLQFQNHYRASKSKLFKINNSRSNKSRRKWNMELIRLCCKTIGYAQAALPIIRKRRDNVGIIDGIKYDMLLSELERVIPLAEQIVDVAQRRIVKGEKVPSSEKVFSIFEEHTDIIVKGQRDIVFGHKGTITTGASGLILDVIIHDGNPSDATVVEDALRRHKGHYQSVPESMVFDGCYSSDHNRETLIKEGVTNISFSKESDDKATCDKATRRALRFFRAGIEATVSMLKRMFGWTRVLDKGRSSFDKALKAGALAYNLFILSRIELKQ
jgi:IS5 family transposase